MPALAGLRVAVLIADGVALSELQEPLRVLEAAGAQPELLAPCSGQIYSEPNGVRGTRLTVARAIAVVPPVEFDALLLPGGALCADALRMRVEVQAFLRDIHQAGKPIATLGHAPWLLVSAGLVPGRTLTASFSIQDDIRNAGGTWVDEPVVHDDTWLTARDAADVPAFLAALPDHFAAPRTSIASRLPAAAAPRATGRGSARRPRVAAPPATIARAQ